MSLIQCPECQKEISDKAKVCPHCGYELPVKDYGVYCPKCLNSRLKMSLKIKGVDNNICPLCKIQMKDSISGTIQEIYDYGENHPELKESPEFDEEAYETWKNWVPISYSSSTGIKCPTCQSTNVQKIGAGERAVSVGMFGLFSKKINKSFKCNSCGYTW